ncbi:MAG TPA: N-acetyltransferase [Pyrinomonadaceae bacterium]
MLKKIRSRLFAAPADARAGEGARNDNGTHARRTEGGERARESAEPRYDIRPLTLAQLDECWRLDQRCFIDGEAYSRETFEYLLTAAEAVAYRAVTADGTMVGFVVGLVEPDHTGHITTIGVAPEHRRRRVAERMLTKVEEAFRRRGLRTARLEVRSVNTGAQQLYRNLGYTVTQRLPRYYSNGGDGLLMLKSLD